MQEECELARLLTPTSRNDFGEVAVSHHPRPVERSMA